MQVLRSSLADRKHLYVCVKTTLQLLLFKNGEETDWSDCFLTHHQFLSKLFSLLTCPSCILQSQVTQHSLLPTSFFFFFFCTPPSVFFIHWLKVQSKQKLKQFKLKQEGESCFYDLYFFQIITSSLQEELK